MTIYDQPKTTYSDQTAQARGISDVIQMIIVRKRSARFGVCCANSTLDLQ